MSNKTKIHWCDGTVNPVMGCNGCELWAPRLKSCYAGVMHEKWSNNIGYSPSFSLPKLFPGRMAKAAKWSNLTGTARPGKPWLDGLPRLIFVSDMGDALSARNAIGPDNKPVRGGAVPFEFLKQEIIDAATSEAGSRHLWLWLTKRPDRMAQFSQWLQKKFDRDIPRNVWVGTTVTMNATLKRIDDLIQVGNKRTVRFLSVEPLWEEISLARKLKGIHWVIVGGESKQKKDIEAKEFRCEWVRRLRDECVKAHVPIFIKQLGGNATIGGESVGLKGSHGEDWSQWPEDLRVRQMPEVK
ncbi:MAG: DUF5131 family protein [Planctomycetota bacterium]